jgi:hypothetical protein
MGFCLFGGPGLLKAPATSEIQGPFASTTAKEAKTHSELTHTLSPPLSKQDFAVRPVWEVSVFSHEKLAVYQKGTGKYSVNRLRETHHE